MARKKIYSTYEAKAKLSELLDRVQEGESITITRRGEPIAEVRPIEQSGDYLAERLKDLERRGLLTPARGRGTLKPIARRPGALKRFLDERE